MVLMRERGRIHRNVVITCQIRTGKAREIASWPVQRHSSSAYTPNGPLSSSARSAATATATKHGSPSTLSKCPFHIISIISGSFANCHQVTVTMQKQYTTTANADSGSGSGSGSPPATIALIASELG